MIQSRHVVKGIFVTSVLESTIMPVPIEAILFPLMQARRDKIWAIALSATVGCIIGSLLGYALGYFLFELAEQWVVGSLTTQEELDHLIIQMQQHGFYFIVMMGIVPLPLQIAMIAAGATGFSLGLYILAITISRVIRYYGIAIAVYYAGNQAEWLIKEYKYTITIVLVVPIFSFWWLNNF